jgi:N-acetylglucosaminyl-diphospho-decaprenol L-rhamnosyltransferase
VAYHRGMATFAEEFGREGCQRLALRNTLLLQWKNLRHPLHVVRQLSALPLRLAVDVCRAPLVPRSRRWMFTGALLAALARVRELSRAPRGTAGRTAREMSFFRKFHPREMAAATATTEGTNR